MEFVRDLHTSEEVKNAVTVIEGGEVKDKATKDFFDNRIPDFFRARSPSDRKRLNIQPNAKRLYGPT